MKCWCLMQSGDASNGKGSNSGVVATYVVHSSPYLWSPLPSFSILIFGLVGFLI